MSKADLWQKYAESGDEIIKKELVLTYLGLVKNLSGRLSVRLPACMNREDLESCGIIGLIEAIDKFNPDLDIEFETFAYRRIRGAMYDEIRRANWIPRSTWQKLNSLYDARSRLEQALGRSVSNYELSRETGIPVQDIHKLNNHLKNLSPVSLDGMTPEEDDSDSLRFTDIFPDPSSPDPLYEICKADDRNNLIKAIELLNERDRLVLALYYQEELTLKEIGQVLEITESRVCQLHSRAIARLRKKLAELTGE